MRNRSTFILHAAVVVLLSLSSAAAVAAVGAVTHLSGVLTARKTDGTTKLLGVKSEIDQGDVLATEDGTYARIRFSDGGEVVLRPGTQLKVDSYSYSETAPQNDNVLLSMFKGGLRAVTGLVGKRNKDKVNFQTSTATIGIRGTHFGALLCQGDCANVPTTSGQTPANGLHVDVVSGAIVMRNSAGTVVVNTGQFGYAAGNNVAPMLVPPEQGVAVTMPGSIAKNRSRGGGIGVTDASDCQAN